MGQKVHALLINEQRNTKATVVVMARQHPGESVGSWMMEGFISRLQQLESNIFWIVIPMVNVDGVKMGNNRTGVLGHDFNRNWNVDEESLRYHLFPELMGIIEYFKRYKK
jgi:murein tripeptide amidase MpaA